VRPRTHLLSINGVGLAVQDFTHEFVSNLASAWEQQNQGLVCWHGYQGRGVSPGRRNSEPDPQVFPR